MSIVLMTNTSDKIGDLSKITVANKRGYAQEWGYRVIEQEFDYDRYNEGILGQLRAIHRQMQVSDVVMTCGADVMFTNWSISIPDVLKTDDRILIARENTGWWPINDDVVIYRCVPEVINFYERLINDFKIWSVYPWRLQAHIWNLMQEEPEVRKLFRIVDAEVMNQHPSRWQLGNWIVHFYGVPITEKITRAKEFAMHWPDGKPLWKQKIESVRPGVI